MCACVPYAKNDLSPTVLWSERMMMRESPGGFIDEARIFVKAGDGGNGISSFRREKFVPRGGPDGGDGGRGGDVVLKGDRNLSSLSHFHYQEKSKAENGGKGGTRKKHGKRGPDQVI